MSAATLYNNNNNNNNNNNDDDNDGDNDGDAQVSESIKRATVWMLYASM